MSLLTKAKAITTNKKHHEDKVDEEMIELAIAFVKHEITGSQAAKVLGVTYGTFQQRANQAVYYAIRNGIIK